MGDYCKSSARTFKEAAVVTDSKFASDIGNDILANKGGNAVDAAIAALFATGLSSPHSCGIGGGSFFVIYVKNQGGQDWHAVNCRETAPLAATKEMFSATGSLRGGKAIAVPGEVKGLYEIHKKFGKVPWRDVVMPSVRRCEEGVPLTYAVQNALQGQKSDRFKREFCEYFDEKGNARPIGTPINLPKLAQTLKTIADDPLSFYNGTLADKIVRDINDAGGIITLEDMKNYTVKWTYPSVMNLPGDFSVYSVPPPGSGPVLGYILNILSGYKLSPASIASDPDSILTHHRIVEAMKFAYGERSYLGDDDSDEVAKVVNNMQSHAYGEATRLKISDDETHEMSFYNPKYQMINDHGTSHISVIDALGNAVSVTSTINTYFGSHVKGNRTGIIFNNEMNDFSTPDKTNYYELPPSERNFIRPGKRPMSSMCPAIVIDNKTGKIKLVTGAAGGSRITSATALNIIDVLWLGMSLHTSIDRPRIHHQLSPQRIQVEKNFPENILKGLRAKGHTEIFIEGKSVVQSALVDSKGIMAVADFRKGGEPSGY